MNRIARGSNARPSFAAIAAWVVAVSVGAAVVAVVSTGRGTPFGDFDKAYYPAGQLATASPSALYDCAHKDGLCFVNVPIVALAFVPLGRLPLRTAHVWMTCIGVASVALTVYLITRLVGIGRWDGYVVATLVLMNGPLFYSLRLANLTHVV